jgi:hypothetical protein
MRQKKRKPVTYKSLEEKYMQKPTFSGGLQRGAEGLLELLKGFEKKEVSIRTITTPTGTSSHIRIRKTKVRNWYLIISLFVAVVCVFTALISPPIGFLVSAAIFISWIVYLSRLKERERKRRNIERFGKAKPSFKEAWPYMKEDLKKVWKQIQEQTQMDVARRDKEELERMKAMDDEMRARYEAGEITEEEMEEFQKELEKRLKRMASKLHKLGV